MRLAPLRYAAVLAATLFSAISARSLLAEDHWLEVRSPHFRVITNGTAGDGRLLLTEFEDMRYVVHYRFPKLRLDSSAPLLIAAPRDLSSAERLEPTREWMNGRITGNFVPGWEQNYATVRLDSFERGARELVYDDYVYSVLHLNAAHLPNWFDHGLSEFFAYTRFMDGKVYVGAPSERRSGLDDGRVLPIATMMGMNEDAVFEDARRTQQFFSGVWALIHYLTFAPGMGDGQKLAEYFEKLQAGEDQMAAFRSVFGEPAAMDPELRTYMGKFLTKAGVIPPPPAMDPNSFTEHELSPAEADTIVGKFHLGIDDIAGGRLLIERAITIDPKLGEAQEALGFVDYNAGKKTEARAEWKRAVELDPKLYRARFADIMTGSPFAERTPDQQNETLQALRSVLRGNQQFAPAYMEVALLHWQRGDLEGALRASQEGERLEPWRAGYHLVTGHILLAQGKGNAAAKIAMDVATDSKGPVQNEALELWQEIPPAERGARPAPSLELPPGVQVARGVVTSLACADRPKERVKLTMQVTGAGSGTTLQLVGGEHAQVRFADTLWRGEHRFASCHQTTAGRATVAFRPAGTDKGELVWLDLTDTFPGNLPPGGKPAGVAVVGTGLPGVQAAR